MKYVLALAFALVLSLGIPVDALASVVVADPGGTEVQIIGPEVFQTGSVIAVASAVAAAIWKIMEKFLGPWGWVAKVARVDHIIKGYLQGGIVELLKRYPNLATKGITVDVGNALIAAVARDFIRVAPGWMIRFLGGRDEIEAKVRNRLPDVLKDLFLVGGTASLVSEVSPPLPAGQSTAAEIRAAGSA